jgi:hypothetical protein
MVIAMKSEVDNKGMKLLNEIERTRYQLPKTIPLIFPFSSFKRTILLFEKI